MRQIVFVLNRLDQGGIVTATTRIVSALRKAGLRVHLFVLLDDEVHSAEIEGVALKFICPKAQLPHNRISKRRFLRKKLLEAVYALGKIEDITLIVCCINGAKTLYRTSLPDIRYAIHFDWYQYLNISFTGFSKWKERRRVLQVYANKRLLFVSKGAQTGAKKLGLETSGSAVIYNPFNFSKISSLSKLQIAAIPHQPYIIHVGRPHYFKRHDRLLQSYARSQASKTHQLYLLTKPDETLTTLICNHGLNGKVIVAGFQPNPYPWMKLATMMISSSDHEALPNVIIESLICGTKVIATDCPSGPAEILSGPLAQYLVTIGDEQSTISDLAERIDEELNRPFIYHQKNLDRFSERTIVEQYRQWLGV